MSDQHIEAATDALERLSFGGGGVAQPVRDLLRVRSIAVVRDWLDSVGLTEERLLDVAEKLGTVPEWSIAEGAVAEWAEAIRAVQP